MSYRGGGEVAGPPGDPRMAQAMRRSHYLQRLQLELTLETNPRDSRYSTQLVELMKREEVAIRENCTSTATTSLIRRVDEALKSETEKFFQKTTRQNVTRWQALQKKIEGELQRFKEETTPFPEMTCPASLVEESAVTDAGFPNYRIPTTKDLDRETIRLEEDYNENWLKYEEYNLQSAFASQIARVESDWIAQEMALADDFNARKAQITGQNAFDSPSRYAGGSPNSDRWQHPEKQKTLIHTAPVLSPTALRRSRDEAPSADVSVTHSCVENRVWTPTGSTNEFPPFPPNPFPLLHPHPTTNPA